MKVPRPWERLRLRLHPVSRVFLSVSRFWRTSREKRSGLDPIGCSPFLPLWNLHKVELFSAFISHLNDISSWKCSWKCKSLQFERKKINMKDCSTFEPATQMVQYWTTLKTLDHWGFAGRKWNNLSTFSINPNPKKNLVSFKTVLNPNQ